MYILVEFTDDREVAVIPHNWLEGNQCAVWPTHLKSHQLRKLELAVINKEEPGESWKAFPIREMYRNDSYQRVREKLSKAENESDLASAHGPHSDEDDDYRRPKRQTKLPSRLVSSSSDEAEGTEEYPSKRPRSSSQQQLPERPPPINVQECLLRSSLQAARRPQSVPVAPNSSGTTSTSRTTPTENARDIRIFTLLEKMVTQQSHILDSVNRVLGIVSTMASPGGALPTDIPAELNLPATSHDDLEAVETALEAPECFTGLVTYLSVQGGVSRTDMSKRVLKTCLTNQLAIQYNWYGKKGKRKFKDLKLAQAVLKSVMKCKKVTATEVEQDCREWFRMAGDRDGGRKRRQKGGQETSVDESLD